MNVEKILDHKGRKVTTADSEITINDIVQMLTNDKIGAIVVTTTDGQVKGIVSERDIVRALSEVGGEALSEPVSRFMTKRVVTCSKEDRVAEIMLSMTAGRFRHMPVVEEGRLAGIISIGDVVKERIAEAELEAQAMREYIATG